MLRNRVEQRCAGVSGLPIHTLSHFSFTFPTLRQLHPKSRCFQTSLPDTSRVSAFRLARFEACFSLWVFHILQQGRNNPSMHCRLLQYLSNNTRIGHVEGSLDVQTDRASPPLSCSQWTCSQFTPPSAPTCSLLQPFGSPVFKHLHD